MVGPSTHGWDSMALQRWWDRRQAKEFFGSDGSVGGSDGSVGGTCKLKRSNAVDFDDVADVKRSHHDAHQRKGMKAGKSSTTPKATSKATSKATPKATPKATSKAASKATSPATTKAPRPKRVQSQTRDVESETEASKAATPKATTPKPPPATPKAATPRATSKRRKNAETQTEGIVINNKIEFFDAPSKATSKATSTQTTWMITPKETVATSWQCLSSKETQTEGIVINKGNGLRDRFGCVAEKGPQSTQTEGIVINKKEPQIDLSMRHGCVRETRARSSGGDSDGADSSRYCNSMDTETEEGLADRI